MGRMVSLGCVWHRPQALAGYDIPMERDLGRILASLGLLSRIRRVAFDAIF